MIEGRGALDADANVVVDGTTYEAGAVVLATGSVALAIPGVEFSDRVVDTWGAWSLPELPKSIAVVGAGASGAEIASAYVRYGTEVTLIEMLPQILPAEDKDVVRVVERVFKKQGIEDPHRQPDRGRRGGREVGQGEGRRRVDRGRVPRDRRRPRARHRGARARRGRRQARRRRADRDRRVPADLEPEGLTRSATSSAARRSPTRPRRRASSPPRRSPAPRRIRSTRTWSPARPSAIRRSPASGSPSSRPRTPARTSRSAG